MSERDYLMDLYDIYKDLLTDKQREYFQNYYLNKIYNVLTVIRETTTDENIKKELDKLL